MSLIGESAASPIRRIDIVCPVYQEEKGIRQFHRALCAVIDKAKDACEFRIRYVLDPSPDRTEDVLRSIALEDDRVEVLVMSRRFGHQAALVAGLDVSDADAAVMLDSDLQHPPELILTFLQCWERGAEIVQAIRSDGNDAGWLARHGSRAFYRLFDRLGATDLQPGAADFRLISRRVVDVLRSEIREQNPFLRGLIGWMGYRIEYVPFVPEKRLAGSSNYRPATLFALGFNGILSFSKRPLRWCVGIGAVLAALAFLGGFIQLGVYLMGTIEVPGWASLFAAVVFLGGVQLFFLGVLGEYLGLVFDEVKSRPRYLVSHSYRSANAGGETPVLMRNERQPHR
jgi:dolichol-phosphate mannosyltransferase